MFFKQIDEIAAGKKTQTRRIVKEGEEIDWNIPDYFTGERRILAVKTNGRLKWQVGRDYAVSPGRGKPGVWWERRSPRTGEPEWSSTAPVAYIVNTWRPLRIRITAIRREPLQDISEDDVLAEGCGLQAWAGAGEEQWPHTAGYAQLWDSINTRKGTRWQDNPAVWALTFEIVT